MMKSTVLLTLIFLFAARIGHGQQDTAWLTGTQNVSCPNEYEPYGVNLDPGCTTSQSYSWTVQGSSDWYTTNAGRGIRVKWPNDNTAKKVSVVAYNNCGSHSLSMDVYVETVQLPTINNAQVEPQKACADTQVLLRAEVDVDLNADADPYNNVYYIWSYSIDGAAPIDLVATQSNPNTYDIPADAAGKDISFTVYVSSVRCGVITSPTFPTGALTVFPAPPAAPVLKLCMDGSSGTLILTDVPGGADTDEYTLTTSALGNFDNLREGDVIGTFAGYVSTAYTLYRYAERPDGGAEGCGVSGNTPSTAATGLTVTATPNCASGISATASNGVGSYMYSLDGGTYQASGTFNNQSASSHIVKAKDAHGCVGDKSVTVIPQLSATVAPKLACPSTDNGAMTINVTGGGGPFEYSINGGALQSANVFTGLTSGTYSVLVKDVNGAGCTHSQSFSLNNSPDIIISDVIPTNPDCAGKATGALQVTASGGTGAFEYTLATAYQAGNSFAGLVAGTYTAKVRDDNDCIKSSNPVSLTDPAAITFTSIEAIPRSCEEKTDGAVEVSTSGGTGLRTYSIDGIEFDPEGAPTRFGGLAPGVYTITVMDAKGCTAMSSTPFVGTLPPIEANLDIKVISCFEAHDGRLTTIPSGGTAPYTYAWSNGITAAVNPNLGPGNYSLTITDDKGCAKIFDAELVEPARLRASAELSEYAGYGVRCAGGADGSIDLSVSGGTPTYSFSWSSGPDTEDINNLETGNYSVTVVDAHGCNATLTDLVIAEPAALTAEIRRTQNTSCFDGADGEIALQAAGGAGTHEYSLDQTLWAPDTLFQGLQAGVYTVYVRDANDCQFNVGTTLTQPTLLMLALSGRTDTSCGESNGSASVEASGGASSYRYEWYDDVDMLISTTHEASSLFSGDYRAVVYDGNECVSEMLVIINDSDGPQVIEQTITGLTCHESNDGSISVNVAGGQTPYLITWDTNATGVTAISNTTAGEHWVEISDASNCRTKAFFTVEAPPPLEANFVSEDPLCTGSANGWIELTAVGGNPGGYAYAWSTGQSAPSVTDLRAGVYTVVVSDSKDCSLEKEIVLTDPPPFVVDAGGDRTICVGQTLPIRAPEDNATYEWTSDVGFLSTEREVVLSSPAVYTLKVTTASGCVDDDSFELSTSNDLLQADFLSTHEAFAGDTIVLVDISWPLPEGISWSFPPGATVVSQQDAYAEVVFGSAGVYDIVLNTFLGECVDSYQKQITILEGRPDAGGRISDRLVRLFEVHPNPSDGRFTVEIALGEALPGRLVLLGLSGNANLFSVPLENKKEMTYDVALDNAPAGVYFLMLETGGMKVIKRVVIR